MSWLRRVIFLAGLVSLGLGVVTAAYALAYWERIVPGVRIAEVNVGNKTGEKTAQLIKERLKINPPAKLELGYQERSWQADPEELNLAIDVNAVVNRAWLVGRKGNLLERVGEASRAFFEGIDQPLIIQADETKLNGLVEMVAFGVDEPAVEPALSLKGKKGERKLELEPGEDGLMVDQAKLRDEILYRWVGLRSDRIEVPVEAVRVRLAEEEVDRVMERAEKLIDKSLIFETEKGQWLLSDAELVGLLDLKSGEPDRGKTAKIVKDYSTGVDRIPQNAALRFEDGRVKEFRPSQDGLTVRQEELTQMTIEAISQLENQDKVVLVTPLARVAPQVATGDVNSLGIRELLGRGTSTYFHSIPNRVHNVGLASRRISGTLVPPGKTFSFNEALGEVSGATGFKSAYVISGGRTVLGDGGGVCQVSTTLFRTALNTGLPIVERKAHAYRVGYYEQDQPAGIDATVYAPSVDLKFKNDTPGYLLIQAEVDEANYFLSFEIYGTSDKRKASITTPRIWGETPPPPALYQDDPTLAVGVVRQVDWSAWGAKTSFDYKVERNSEIIFEKTFTSSYRPWQAVYLRGAKTN